LVYVAAGARMQVERDATLQQTMVQTDVLGQMHHKVSNAGNAAAFSKQQLPSSVYQAELCMLRNQ
jgi:hypothetical protein